MGDPGLVQTRPGERSPRARFVRSRLSLVGLGFASVTYLAALQPSLLPRPLMFLVILSALGVVGGYALGALISWLLNLNSWIRMHHPKRWLAWVLVGIVWLPSLLFTPIAITWQAEQQSELDMPSTLPGSLGLVGFTLVVSVVFLLIGRSLRLLTATVARGFNQWIWPRHAEVVLSRAKVRFTRVGVAFIFVGVAAIGLGAGFNWLVDSYNTTNGSVAGQSPDRVGENSGGTDSLVAWETLGRQGRAFVGNPTPVSAISAVTGEPAVDPLRIYVGMEQGSTPDERSKLAVAELDRSGAWDREYLAIFVVTGTGWVDPNGVNSLEIVTGGDVTTVAIQYSAVPSWIGFVIDPATAMAQGASQVNTIVEAWRQQPEETRPKLILFGQSLGTFGSQAAWDQSATPVDVVKEIGKVIWIGPPAQSRLWEQWQADRSAGPAWQPVIGDGDIARVFVTPGELTGAEPASGPSIAIAAHANDPVVYWSPSLFLTQPDWSEQPLGPGVDPHFRWIPGITYLSVGFDLISGGEPPEVGHNYSANIGPAVALTVNPPSWTAAKTQALQDALPELLYPTD